MLDLIRAMYRRLQTRLFAAALLLPLVALATATSGFGLRCRITGAVLDTCCCGDGESAKAQPVSTVSEADCCDRVVRNVSPAPAELTVAPSALPKPAAPTIFVAFAGPKLDHDPAALSPRSDARPSIGPPTVLLRLVAKSTFLI
jgi:hypothetical protein